MTDLIPQQYPVPTDPSEHCRCCGAYPATKAHFRGHRGLILVMQFFGEKGPFCRTCGIATFRTMTSRTLVQGWWGYISFLVTPFILLWNLFQRTKVAKLPEPVLRNEPGSPTPLPVGRPLYLRPTILGLLVPLSVVVFIGVIAGTGGPESLVGQCIVTTKAGTDNVDFVSCDKPNEGRVISVADNEDLCPDDATSWVQRIRVSKRGVESEMDGGRVLCIKE